jgi:hypothetical protein
MEEVSEPSSLLASAGHLSRICISSEVSDFRFGVIFGSNRNVGNALPDP